MRTSPTGTWSPQGSAAAALGTNPYTQSATVLSMSNGNTYYFGIGDGVSTLPITLITFIVIKEAEENIVDLDWNTGSEINNDYFEIERSTDGRSWSSIDQVQGHGNSLVHNSYHAADNLEGVVPAGVIYYRLKQVDFNGAFTYSNIRAVKFDNDSLNLTVYPNPTAGIINLSWLNTDETSNTVQICNMQGQVLYCEQNAGMGLMDKQIDISWLPTGTYIL